MRQPPDYKVGGWVVTDLGELAQVVAIKDKSGGPDLRSRSTRASRTRPRSCSRRTDAPGDDGRGDGRRRPRGSNGARRGTRLNGPEAVKKEEGAAQEGRPAEPGRGKTAGRIRDVPTPRTEAHDRQCGRSPEAELAQDGKAEKYEATSLKDLCKLAEHHATRQKLFDLFKEHGVVKLGADAAKDASLRAAVLELVP